MKTQDIEAFDLCNELQATARQVPKCMSPQDVTNFILKNKQFSTVIALGVLLTLPVYVASGEQSFSKLKFKKTCRHPCYKKLEIIYGLLTRSIQHDIVVLKLNDVLKITLSLERC